MSRSAAVLLVIAISINTLLVAPLSRQAVAEAVAAKIDDARAAAAGIRKLDGRHLVLYTDLPAGAAVDALPAVFDAAVPLWVAYFGVDPAATTDWRVRAFLIGDREKFAALELMPPEHELTNGYSLGSDVWVMDQATDYYRRHLLLHEGTHAFMNRFLGGCGPGWYMEGMAELLATHRMGAGSRERGAGSKELLTLGIMPRDRGEVPMLGRIKLIQDALANHRGVSLPAVMEIDSSRQLGNDAYAWCWAAAKFFDSHPRYQERFRTLKEHVKNGDFNERLKKLYAAEWNEILAEWQAFVVALEHGYDFERMAIQFERGEPLSRERRDAVIRADRGWQSSGVWLEAGKTYRVTARGRFQIGVEKTSGGEITWPCEAGGVTIEYHDGRPLGILLGAVVPDDASRREGFSRPLAIGLGRLITPGASGTLYLRVNDSAARLGDNRGALTITVED